jgi:hypothetical protein
VASGASRAELRQQLQALGFHPSHVVKEFIEDPDVSCLG